MPKVNNIQCCVHGGPLKHILPLCLSAVLIAGTVDSAVGQSPARVSGRVVSAQSGEPLPGVNVFLSGTLRGTATDDAGRFYIDAVPVGSYTLVASMVGFEAVARPVDLDAYTEHDFLLELSPATYQLSGIEVKGEFDREWWNRLRKFKRLFFSTTGNA